MDVIERRGTSEMSKLDRLLVMIAFAIMGAAILLSLVAVLMVLVYR